MIFPRNDTLGADVPKPCGAVAVILALGAFLTGAVALPAADTDGDGFSDALESRYDWNATLADDRRKGGIARTRSAVVTVGLGGGGVVNVSSDPAGIVNPLSQGLTTGQSMTTVTNTPISGNKRFLYWERNGQILRGAGGTPPPSVTEDNVGTGVNLVAKYADGDVDSDADGLPDWFELKQTADLSPTPESDDDADGFSLAREKHYGFSPHLKDSRTRGGISRNRSAVLAVSLGGGGVLNVSSDPAGLVENLSQSLEAGQSLDTVTLVPKIGNKRFLYWERMGQQVRSTGGTPPPRATESEIGTGINLVAKFEDEDADADGDGLPDWFEKRAGDLSLAPGSDGDADGFTLDQEYRYGFSPFLKDMRPRGGITRRRSGTFSLSGEENATQPDPTPDLDGDGIADHLDFDTDGDGSSDAEEFSNGTNPADANSVVYSKKILASLGGEIKFWLDASELTADGTVWPDKSGLERHATKHGSPTLVPNFLNGKPVMQYGSADDEYHSFPQLTDIRTVFWVLRSNAVNHAPVLGDTQQYHFHQDTSKFWNSNAHSHVKGGLLQLNGTTINGSSTAKPTTFAVVSLRTTGDVTASNFGKDRIHENRCWKGELAELIIFTSALSDPAISELEGALAHKWGLTANLPLDHPYKDTDPNIFGNDPPDSLDLNGTTVPENQPIGTVVGEFNATNPDANATISFAFVDGPGATHNDRFTIGPDGILRTASALDHESDTHLFIRVAAIDAGNASIEKMFTLQVLNDPVEDNQPPGDILLDNNVTTENLPGGSVVGRFTATDPDANATHVITLADGNGSADNGSFSLDANGTLKTAAILDHEANATLSIRVKATDDYNASIEKAFVVSVTNVVEDLDDDGIEDHFDPDDDGDGFSDVVEIAYGSDPRDASSVANQAPTQLDINGSTIAENSNAVSVVGILTATDPDTNATITLTFTDGNGSQHNNLYTLDANGTLRTTATFDYETNATALHIRIKATDEHNASLAKAFVINVTNVVEDLDGDGIEDHYDPDDDGDGFSDAEEIAYGSDPRNAASVANQAPTQLDLNGSTIAENSNAISVVGIF